MIKIYVDRNPEEARQYEDIDVTFEDNHSATVFINVLNTLDEELASSIIYRGDDDWHSYFDNHHNDFTLEHYLDAKDFLTVVNFLKTIYDVSIEIEEESLIESKED